MRKLKKNVITGSIGAAMLVAYVAVQTIASDAPSGLDEPVPPKDQTYTGVKSAPHATSNSS